jgi:ElaB/YqjD/DUF883 family membrane-anchored ribosome-binding protein
VEGSFRWLERQKIQDQVHPNRAQFFENMNLRSARSVLGNMQVKERVMKSNVLKDAAKTSERVVERFAASKEAVSDAWDDTRHFVTRTRRTMRDLLGDAKYNIKRFPLRSVALAFGAGAVVGILISRNGKS